MTMTRLIHLLVSHRKTNNSSSSPLVSVRGWMSYWFWIVFELRRVHCSLKCSWETKLKRDVPANFLMTFHCTCLLAGLSTESFSIIKTQSHMPSNLTHDSNADFYNKLFWGSLKCQTNLCFNMTVEQFRLNWLTLEALSLLSLSLRRSFIQFLKKWKWFVHVHSNAGNFSCWSFPVYHLVNYWRNVMLGRLWLCKLTLKAIILQELVGFTVSLT